MVPRKYALGVRPDLEMLQEHPKSRVYDAGHMVSDIRDAATLHADHYRVPALYHRQIETAFASGWHILAPVDPVPEPGMIAPLTLLEGSLDEPVVLARDLDGTRRALSNVCTHRGNLLVAPGLAPCRAPNLRCGYHGRRFTLAGKFAHMPEFEDARNFPSPADDLPIIASASWGPVVFGSLGSRVGFEAWIGPLRERFAFVPWDRLELAEPPKHYEVAAHWALYCDNYLEGFHVPFVHPGLAREIEYGSYTTELFDWGVLQIGFAQGDAPAFDLPAGHPDSGRRVAAYWAFLFPGTMINVYPWGVSLNIVAPQGPARTRVIFASLVHDPSKRGVGAGGDLHSVELEDEAVVESVQRGVRSRLYSRGRYSPSRETGVHHFHQLIESALAASTIV
ncbi:MAG: SRPBCC family protein [Polyangiaceae bacterium]